MKEQIKQTSPEELRNKKFDDIMEKLKNSAEEHNVDISLLLKFIDNVNDAFEKRSMEELSPDDDKTEHVLNNILSAGQNLINRYAEKSKPIKKQGGGISETIDQLKGAGMGGTFDDKPPRSDIYAKKW